MPFGAVFAVFFFLLLFFAATSSAISFIEVPTAALAGAFGKSRRSMATLVTVILIIIGLPAAASYSAFSLSFQGIPILDAMDEVFGTIGLSTSALLLSIAFAWLFDQKALWGDLSESSPFIRAVPILCRYVIPVAVLITITFRVAALF